MPDQVTNRRGGIAYAIGLLETARQNESENVIAIGAMAVAEGTLRMLLTETDPDPDLDDPDPTALALITRGAGAGDRDWAALALITRARREWLGLSQGDVAKAGGPSEQSLRRIEGAQRSEYTSSTLSRLERALEWPPGTTTALLAGTADRQKLIIKLRRKGDLRE